MIFSKATISTILWSANQTGHNSDPSLISKKAKNSHSQAWKAFTLITSKTIGEANLLPSVTLLTAQSSDGAVRVSLTQSQQSTTPPLSKATLKLHASTQSGSTTLNSSSWTAFVKATSPFKTSSYIWTQLLNKSSKSKSSTTCGSLIPALAEEK